jgi:riboflavin synthase
MFTGLIQCMGRVDSLSRRDQETRLRIHPLVPMERVIKGESIAVNGVCLTVETFGRDLFEVYASAETMSRTNLGALNAGALVNLERALALGDRLGGHMVSGHVDCLAKVEEVRPSGESRIFRLSFEDRFAPQVVEKGSVALDGISLTVNACRADELEVNIIPATWKETTISGWKPAVRVNMETDLIGKYVQRMIEPWVEGKKDKGESAVTMEFLRKHGF